MSNSDKKFPQKGAARLLAAERFREFDPENLLKEMDLKPGMTAADIGCGNGFFSVPAAKIVAPDGMLHALDISSEMLDLLKARRPPANLQVHLCEENRFPLKTNSIDFVLLSAVFHEIENRDKFLLEIRRILRDDGHLWILEWQPKEETKGPPALHRISQTELRSSLTKNGFTVSRADNIGESHYQVLSRKKVVSCRV
ncbi:MAG TPA: class I SAM-dependent methyltransferase [Bacteroidetes bacterium]|nr:class I SAM-dependent methyltransferase [Bacteroidota bacterium]